MAERVDRVAHVWDDGSDYSIGARLHADRVWRSVIDTWVRPDPLGEYRVVGNRRVRRRGELLLELDLQLVQDDRYDPLGDETPGQPVSPP